MITNETLALLEEMAVFAKVVETGSFSEAARQLGATPSAISRAVSRLERALNTRLLQRTTRKLRLNESGKAVYQHCQALVNSAGAVMSASGQFSETPSGLVRLGAPKALGYFMVHPLINEFLAMNSGVNVMLRLEDRYMDLIDEDIDLAIRITNEPPPGLIGKRLFTVSHILCATPQYLAEHGTPSHPQELKEHSCLFLSEEAADTRWRFQQGNKVVSVNVHGRYSSNHSGVRLGGVKSHLGIGGLPVFTARKSLESGDIVQVLPDWTFKTRYSGDAWLLYPPSRYQPPHMMVFIDYLVKKLRT
ncbi:LysR family transcriptional regulator [Morganella morganii]|uniref:LysR family transcriptional regulator n=1 Tax=Morganella morganii TaxID=582 RepID=UPI003EBCBC2A